MNLEMLIQVCVVHSLGLSGLLAIQYNIIIIVLFFMSIYTMFYYKFIIQY